MLNDETLVSAKMNNDDLYARQSQEKEFVDNVTYTHVTDARAHDFTKDLGGSTAGRESAFQKKNVENKIVLGFLYSISSGKTEFWPIYQGKNRIGRSPENDIQLKEASVSERHAELCVREMKTTHKIIATIRDVGSKNGMFLNEEELDYEDHSCKDGDVIVVGSNYKLLLILVDTVKSGLCVSPHFQPIKSRRADTIEQDSSDIYESNNTGRIKNDNDTLYLNGADPSDSPRKTKVR